MSRKAANIILRRSSLKARIPCSVLPRLVTDRHI